MARLRTARACPITQRPDLPFRNFAAHRRDASDKRAPARSRACQAIGVQKIVLSLLTRGRAVRMVE